MKYSSGTQFHFSELGRNLVRKVPSGTAPELSSKNMELVQGTQFQLLYIYLCFQCQTFKNWYILLAHFFTMSKININKDIAPTCSADPPVHPLPDPPKTLPSFSATTFAKKIRKMWNQNRNQFQNQRILNGFQFHFCSGTGIGFQFHFRGGTRNGFQFHFFRNCDNTAHNPKSAKPVFRTHILKRVPNRF